MFNGVVLGAVWWIVRYTDFQPKEFSQCLQGFLEDMPIGGVTAAAIAEQ
jgi:hypothetical protein